MQRRARGFTLIELAIVVAIIGLIAAAILLSGSGVFGRTGVASLLSNIKDLATASREFKVRYGYFPGDLPAAGAVITANGGISPGCTYNYNSTGKVGDGVVNFNDPPAPESDCALEHLVKAGMLSKIEYDKSAPTPRFFIGSTVGENVRVSLWFNDATSENVIRVTNLPCDVALDLDRKLDSTTTDNKPLSQGTVTARNGANAVIETCAVGGLNDPVATLLIKY